MGKVQILDKIGRVIPTKTPPTIPVEAASNAFSRLIETHHEYKKIAAQEKSKREAVKAWKDVRLTELKNQKEILRSYLEETFKERRYMIDGLFEALDKGIEANNLDVINGAIGGIINVAKESPLQQVDKLMLSLQNDDVKVIEF